MTKDEKWAIDMVADCVFTIYDTDDLRPLFDSMVEKGYMNKREEPAYTKAGFSSYIHYSLTDNGKEELQKIRKGE